MCCKAPTLSKELTYNSLYGLMVLNTIFYQAVISSPDFAMEARNTLSHRIPMDRTN